MRPGRGEDYLLRPFVVLGERVLGIVLVVIGDNVFDFGQTWIWLSMIVFIGILALGLVYAWRKGVLRWA